MVGMVGMVGSGVMVADGELIAEELGLLGVTKTPRDGVTLRVGVSSLGGVAQPTRNIIARAKSNVLRINLSLDQHTPKHFWGH